MNLATQSRGISVMQRKYMFAGLLLLSFTLASHGAMADLNDRSASAFGPSAPATRESNADSDQRFVALFRAASLSLTQAIASAERLHAGSRTAAITFDISGTPGLSGEDRQKQRDVGKYHRRQHWKGPEFALSLNELKAEERDNIIALRSVGQELPDAVAIAEKAATGKAISGGLVKESDQITFVVVVLSDDRVKEVILEPPRAPSKSQQTTARKNRSNQH